MRSAIDADTLPAGWKRVPGVEPLVAQIKCGEAQLQKMCSLRPEHAEKYKHDHATAVEMLLERIFRKVRAYSASRAVLNIDSQGRVECPHCGAELAAAIEPCRKGYD